MNSFINEKPQHLYYLHEISFNVNNDKKTIRFCCHTMTQDVANIVVSGCFYRTYGEAGSKREEMEKQLEKTKTATFNYQDKVVTVSNISFRRIRPASEKVHKRMNSTTYDLIQI